MDSAAASISSNWLAFVDCAMFSSLDFLGFVVVFEDAAGDFSLAISGFNEG